MRIELCGVAGDATAAVLVRETKAGDRYIQEESVRRAAKKIGCPLESLRIGRFAICK